ncbi:MAG: TolC family protein [Pirellulales bacterium]
MTAVHAVMLALTLAAGLALWRSTRTPTSPESTAQPTVAASAERPQVEMIAADETTGAPPWPTLQAAPEEHQFETPAAGIIDISPPPKIVAAPQILRFPTGASTELSAANAVALPTVAAMPTSDAAPIVAPAVAEVAEVPGKQIVIEPVGATLPPVRRGLSFPSTASTAPVSPPIETQPPIAATPSPAVELVAAAPPRSPEPAAPVAPPATPQTELIPSQETVTNTPPATGSGSSPFASAPDPWSGLGSSMPPQDVEAATISVDDARLMALRNNKDVAVLGYAPQITGATVDQELSAFDPVFNVNMQGGHYFRQTSTLVQALGTGIPTLNTTFWQPGVGLNQVYIEKLFASGGRVQAGAGHNLASYSPGGNFVLVNPAWQSSLNLLFEQPLFRGRGPVATQALLQIARANQDQSWQAFQTLVNQILRDAELAYWETADSYRELQLRDLALAQALQTLDREQERMRIGEGALPEVAQAQEHVEEYRIDRADAAARYVYAQRELRRVMGVPPDDPRPIVPTTMLSEAPIVVDWNAGTTEAMNRPELAAQRAAVEACEAEYRRRLNGLQPDLAVRAIYSVTGLDSQLDGAWRSVGSWDYNDWTAGVVYRQPLGRRSDNALARRAEATLAMETARLRRLEHEITHEVASALEHVQATEQMLTLQRRRREAAALQLDARRELYTEGRAYLRDQIDAEERYATAMIDEAAARADYQRALTAWNYARGAMNDQTLVMGP